MITPIIRRKVTLSLALAALLSFICHVVSAQFMEQNEKGRWVRPRKRIYFSPDYGKRFGITVKVGDEIRECALRYQEVADRTIKDGDKITTAEIPVSGYCGAPFAFTPLEVDTSVVLPQETIIKIEGCRDNALVPTVDSGVPFWVEHSGGQLTMQPLVRAIGAVWQFERASISFSAIDSFGNTIIYVSEKEGATVKFTKEGLVLTNIRKLCRGKWWREARFGMFIHWGIYSVPAGIYKGEKIPGIGEWIMERAKIPVEQYEQFAKQFNPVKFDADQWVQIAKNAGMKYIVITSKHHDGFCLWDTKFTDYDIIDATPFKRDILAELAESCKKHGVRLCFYHSIMDWHHPDAQAPYYPNYDDRRREQTNPNFSRYVENYLKPQLKELITNYGPLGVLWFDGEWITEWTEPQGKDMYNYVLSLQPNIIINNRVGKGRKGLEGFSDSEEPVGDFGTPEQRIPATGLPNVDWETCMTMNDTWGYKSYDHNWKSTKDLLHKLADIASKGGNFLLNVGPTAEGLIPQPSVERLAAIGEWMKVNSESIYGTTASPLGSLPWGRCTAKPGKLYLHVFNWPKDSKLNVPNLTTTVKKAYLLADKKHKKLEVARVGDNEVVISVPEKAPDPINTVIVVEIK